MIKILLISLLVLLTGCKYDDELIVSPSSETIIDNDVVMNDDEVQDLLIDYTNNKGCDLEVAFRIYVIKNYRDILAEDPHIILERLENDEVIYDLDGNEIVINLDGMYEANIIDDICQFKSIE